MSPPPDHAEHGGAFWSALGEEFAHLERKDRIVPADVLDAWFDPSPRVVEVLLQELSWLCKTSPPTHCEGLIRTISRVRGIAPEGLICSAGSSSLLFNALPHVVRSGEPVLVLDPTYGEYEHLLGNVLGCRLLKLKLEADNQFDANVDRLIETALSAEAKLVALVNPNSPTGRPIPREEILRLHGALPASALLWVDETYVDYAGSEHSLEGLAPATQNLFVSKSMSKAYALSGLRVAYGTGPADLIAKLDRSTPPWSVSLPGQMAGVLALEDEPYYREKWQATANLRSTLIARLRAMQIGQVIEGAANFVLVLLEASLPTAEVVCDRCKAQGVFIRNASPMGESLGVRAIRIAVRSADENERVLSALKSAIRSRA